MSTRVSDQLARVEVRDTDDKPLAVRDLWRDRPALILWVRHFG